MSDQQYRQKKTREIELKIQLADEKLVLLEQWLERHGKFVGVLEQKDLYFDHPDRTFFQLDGKGQPYADQCLRIRITNDNAIVCYKRWYRDSAGEQTHCDELEVSVVDGDKIEQIFMWMK